MIHGPGFLKLVEDAKTRVREVSVAEVRAMLERKDALCFVDVREDCEWDQGRASGALHLGKGVIERDIERRIPDKNARIVLYCGGGYRSALAADALQRMGYTNVFSMAGGIRSWRECGFPIDEGIMP